MINMIDCVRLAGTLALHPSRLRAFAWNNRAALLHSSLRTTAWSQQERLTRDIRPATCGWNSP